MQHLQESRSSWASWASFKGAGSRGPLQIYDLITSLSPGEATKYCKMLGVWGDIPRKDRGKKLGVASDSSRTAYPIFHSASCRSDRTNDIQPHAGYSNGKSHHITSHHIAGIQKIFGEARQGWLDHEPHRWNGVVCKSPFSSNLSLSNFDVLGSVRGIRLEYK
ncbi:hypothetical protein ONS95_009285 [Cadophora gregata]|uniref:uncharacterized protein n=1 Tax=Cadophora gregata TaxID=51156 RepID=UPI0026DB3546|nr:uncharacterized protein ONS95_009285 [Cadophora gregata]KAK0124314.1 hypothetical protein ONS95_009285 [Cadophora gregata]